MHTSTTLCFTPGLQLSDASDAQIPPDFRPTRIIPVKPALCRLLSIVIVPFAFYTLFVQ